MSITTLGLMGASLANAQDVSPTTNTQAGAGMKMMQNLTDAQKAVMEKAKALFEAGKKDEAKTLLETNGIKMPQGHGRGMGKGMRGDHGNRKAIEEAITAGDFTAFQTVASSSPLKGLNQATFNLLTPQFTAKKNAEDQIRAILKAAGIAEPTRGNDSQKTTK